MTDAAAQPGSDQAAVDDLVSLLRLEQMDDDLYLGHNPAGSRRRVFGGQLAAQSLMAAGRTVATDRHAHSLHSYFIRPADPSLPTEIRVERIRNGRTFSTRRATTTQNGRMLFSLMASFQTHRSGAEHQPAMPDTPAPEMLPTVAQRAASGSEHYAATVRRVRAFDLRYVDLPSWDVNHATSAWQRAWLRVDGLLPEDPLLHVAALIYASDLTPLDAVFLRQGISRNTHQIALSSLDHTMWFTQPVRADDWILLVKHSPVATSGRGLSVGHFFSRTGLLLATMAQEGLITIE